MPYREIEDINEFFFAEGGEKSPDEKWEVVFKDWISKIEQKKLLLNLFELKLWCESLEEFFSSAYLEGLIFKKTAANLRNYEFYVATFVQVVGKIISQLKDLDFKKDKLLLNFEEFIVSRILESYITKTIPNITDIYSSKSWFYSMRIFLQNLKNMASEILKNDFISQRSYSSLKKMYHKELISNPLIITLLKKRFIPRMDKIYQQDISDIISEIKAKDLKRDVGIFFILAFRVVKMNDFIEMNLNKSRNVDLLIPLVLALKKNTENVFSFYDRALGKKIKAAIDDNQSLAEIKKTISELQKEYQKIYQTELVNYFDFSDEKVNRRKIIKNIVIISDITIKEFIEAIAQQFKPEISGSKMFEHYISRKQESMNVLKKLTKLHAKISGYFLKKQHISPEDILFDLNLFIETDLNYLLFKDWNEFLKYYNDLINISFSSEFEANLKAFQSFITKVLKEMAEVK